MKKPLSKSTVIILVVIAILLVLMIIGVIFTSRSERISKNPAGTVGNTAGNLNNSGLFCESDGLVYFANSFDEGALYCMTVDEKEIKKISTASVCNILSGGDYLYYFQLGASGTTGLGGVRTPHSFIRSHKDGSNAYSLVREVITKGQLLGDTLFLLGQDDDAYLFRIQTDGSERLDLTSYILNPAGTDGSQLFYNGTVSDHYLYTLNPANNVQTLYLAESLWNPVVDGDYIYYLDLSEKYQLRRYSISSQSIEILCKDKIESFNVGNGYIYYQTFGKNAYLGFMNLDGSNSTVLTAGNFTAINMTSRYVYFQAYGDEDTTYHAPLGQPYYEAFSAASAAVVR